MKQIIAALFAASLMMSACGSSSSDATTDVAADSGSDAAIDTETTTVEATNDDSEAADTDTGGDLSDDGLALATAMTEAQMVDGDNPFTRDEIQCANEGVVQTLGLDELNGWGITVDNPDDTLVPDEYEVQKKAIAAITDCVSIGQTFRALAGSDCDIPLSDDEMEMAMTYDFLSDFPEHDDPAAMAASEAMDAAIAACG